MRHGHAVTGMAAGALASLVALAACATQAQTQVPEPTRNETIVVTGPTQTRTRTYTTTRQAPATDARTYFVTRNSAHQDPAAGEAQEIRIERKVVDGQEDVRLWINGKEIEVETMEDVHKVIGESNLDAHVEFFGGEADGARGLRLHGPGQMRVQLDALPLPDGAFELTMPEFDVSTLGVFNQPKSMLGVSLEPISDDLRDYLGLAEEAGARIAAVVDNSAAAKAGLQKGDIVVAITAGSEPHDGVSVAKLREIISQSEPGTEVSITVLRKGERLTVDATLAEWDGERLGQLGLFESPTILRGLGGEDFQLELSPTIRRGLESNRLLELQPMMRRLERDTEETIRRALPDHEEMMRLMEQQLQEVQRLLEGIRQQQEELRRDLKPSSSAPDA